jgi:hypothetical protein
MSDALTIAAIQRQLATAQIAISNAQTLVNSLTPPPSSIISTPAALDAALAKATGGETFLLDPGLVYPTPLVLTKGVTLKNALMSTGRATLTSTMPRFQAGVTCAGSALIALYGLEIRHTNPLTDIVVLGAGTDSHRVLDGCRVLGDPVKGAKRGIAGNVADVTVIRCYVEDCFQASPGNDSQAFAAWESPGPFVLTDSYFSGGSETVLFGGADPSSAANIPSNITITGCTITKRAAWQGKPIGVKNVIELKNAKHVLIENCDISLSWGQGQTGYLVMLTPRNQSGTAPYSTVFDVTIRNNRFSSGSAWINMLGSDDLNPSGPLDTVIVTGNQVSDIDPVKYQGSGQLIQSLNGPKNISVIANAISGKNLNTQVYFDGAPQCVNFNVTGNTWPAATYGVFGSGCAPGGTTGPTNQAWQKFVASGLLNGNTVV